MAILSALPALMVVHAPSTVVVPKGYHAPLKAGKKIGITMSLVNSLARLRLRSLAAASILL